MQPFGVDFYVVYLLESFTLLRVDILNVFSMVGLEFGDCEVIRKWNVIGHWPGRSTSCEVNI